MRIAFVGDPRYLTDERLDAILQYNLTRWGGRLNPVIFSDGEQISDEWWRFLIGFDPDVVVPLMTLSEGLKDEIGRRVAPLSIEDYREPESGIRFSIHTQRDGLSIYPDPESLESLAHWIRIGPPRLVVFDIDDANDVLRRFVSRNFGVYYRTIFMDSVLEKIDVATFKITSVESLANAIEELSSPVPRAWIYPIQFSILAGTWPPVIWNYARDAFTVTLGDSVEDITHFWNHPLTLASSNRKGINEIWLPSELARDDQLRKALPRWFRKLCGWMHAADQPIQFVTHSLSEADLQSAVNGLVPENEFYPTESSRLTSAQIPEFEEVSPYASFIKTADMSWHVGSAKKTVLSIDCPTRTWRDGHWISDIHIEYDPEKLGYYSNKELMWQLPRKNHICSHVFRKQARVNSERYPSVLISGANTSLEILLPSEVGLFWNLICNEPSPFKAARPSEKGRYLSGIIELFSGLFQAYSLLNERYWRRVFEEMSVRESQDAEAAPNKIRKLVKKLKEGQNIDEEEAIGRLLAAAKRGFRKGLDFRLEDFETKAKEHGENLEWLHLDWHIQSFIESNILRVGVTSKCERCGYRDWYHISEIRQTITCNGCGNTFPVHVRDDKWHYRLNSLVRAGVGEHGSIPVILTLGKLLRESRKSFIFVPSLDLYENLDAEKWGDLDLVCIQDGKLVIGEVKSSVSLFDLDDVGKMDFVARSIVPDVLIFSVERGDIGKKPQLAGRIERLRKDLEPLGIEVRWLFVGEDERLSGDPNSWLT